MEFWDKYFSDLPNVRISDTKEVSAVSISDFLVIFCAHYNLDLKLDKSWLIGHPVQTYNQEEKHIQSRLKTHFFVYSEDYNIITKQYYEWCCKQINFEYLTNDEYIQELRAALMKTEIFRAKVILFVGSLIAVIVVVMLAVNGDTHIQESQSKAEKKLYFMIYLLPVIFVLGIPGVVVESRSNTKLKACKKRMIENV